MLIPMNAFIQKIRHQGTPAKLLLLMLVCAAVVVCQCRAQDSPWQQMSSIVERIKPPVFPEKNFLVTEFGAKGDGVTDCSAAFKKAIEECSRAGGGRVVVPGGRFLTGPIYLKSNVDLRLEEGSVVAFQQDPGAYLPWYSLAGKVWNV